VLRLSAGMTMKAAAAGVSFGGGKAVIIGDPSVRKSPALLQAMGRAVERLGGRFLTAEDVGIGEHDVAHMRETTGYLMGLPIAEGGGGDPSPTTALGVFYGMMAAVAHRWGVDHLDGRVVAVQGLGNVGWNLCALVRKAGGRLIVADTDSAKAARAAQDFDAAVVAPNEIYAAPADVFSPCAMGAVLNAQTIPVLKARIIAGGANNQLADDAAGDLLFARGVTYAPDYAVNAGGMVRVAAELTGFDAAQVERDVAKIGERTRIILERADSEGVAPHRVAAMIARERLALERKTARQ
jgi:leucine dehydrogenase